MWSRHWKTADPRAERELNLHPDRFSLKVETEKKITWCKIWGVGRVTKFEYFPWSDTLVPALTCVQVRYHEEVWFHACLRLVELFFGSICSVPKEHSLCSIPLWCAFLPCVISVVWCPLSKQILCKVPSSRSGITLRFGAHPHLLVPMLCSLLFSKVQDNIATFHHQLPTHRDALSRNFPTFWGARLNMLPYPSSAGASKYGGSVLRKLCGSWACYAVCWKHSPMKYSGHWLLPPMKCKLLHWSWPSHMQPTLCSTFCYFSPCP